MSENLIQPTNSPLRVLHCVLSLEVGGLERIVVDLVRIGKQRGLEVSVLCLERAGTLEAQVRSYGATVTCFHKPPGIVRETVQQAQEFLARTKPDVVHTHQIGALWYVGQAARLVGVKAVIHTEHIDNVLKARGWWRKLKCRILWHRAARYAQRFCCVSDDIARSAARWWTVPRTKLKVILNGVDTDLFRDRASATSLREELGISATVHIIGNVGRLNEVKRQDLLLGAFARLKEQIADVHLLLVGDGPERGRLQDLAQRLGILPGVTFAGYQSAPQKYLQIMDVFALTSRLEGLPLVLLEAWAAGLPVISTAVGGVPDLVHHGENGLLIPSGDENALVLALKTMLENPVQAQEFAERGQSLVQQRYSLARMATDYEALYRELLALQREEQACASSS